VVNDGAADSAPDTVTISTLNSAPVADAGPDQSVYVGNTVTLDGSGSSDVDGDLLTYQWSLTSVPSGSTATLSDAAVVNPTFAVDLPGTYVAQLIVDDGTADSAPDTVAISTLNSAPVANAGPDQSVYVGNTVTLDGSGSSDVDGDLLTYQWSLTSVPSGSSAALSDPTAVNPTFAVDLPGTYVAQLIVDDGTVDSDPDTVSISTINVAPIADAGDDQSVNVGDLVTLDGSGSSDPDGDPLTYNWAFTSTPAGSSATLDDPTSVNATFTADVAGTYVASLVVNDGALDSEPDTVTISTINVAPIADAGDDQSVNVGNLVPLDGSNSWDPDGDPLTYSWAFTSIPAGSSASLNNPASVNPTFTADAAGTYVVSLVVNDGTVDSAPYTVTISTINVAPIADAGDDQSVNVGNLVTLDGSNSSDPDGDPLTFNWAFTSFPAGSAATLNDATSVNPTFTADVAGTYVVSLMVNDGTVDSEPDKVTISAVTQQTEAILKVQDGIIAINEIAPEAFNNPNNKKALTSKLNAVIEKLEDGEYQDALKKLENDILNKIDGCALTGSPDKNDWIKDCDSQAVIYPLVLDVIDLLK
jgi:ethanolamine utilization protein EutQ (cupin superfamily)